MEDHGEPQPVPTFGEQLRRLRQERGISLAAFAQLVNYDLGYLSKIENSRKPPSESLAQRCDDALDTSGQLIAAWRQIAQKPARSKTRANPTTFDRSEPMVEAWELTDALTRSTLSATALDYLERAVVDHAARYPSTSPDALLSLVSAPLLRLQQALHEPQPLRTRQRAVTLLGTLSGLAGNLWLDLDKPDRAAEFFNVGELAGHEADNPDLTAWVLATRSIGPYYAGQPTSAVALLTRADRAAQSRSSGRRRGWITALQARAAAATADQRHAYATLDRAYDQLDTTTEPATGTDFFDRPRLDGIAGSTYLLLSDIPRAVAALTDALDRRDPGDLKGRALLMLDLAECHSKASEPDEAARVALAVLAIAHGTMVKPIQARLHTVRASLSSWGDQPVVRDLDAGIRELDQ